LEDGDIYSMDDLKDDCVFKRFNNNELKDIILGFNSPNFEWEYYENGKLFKTIEKD
jgi:hypothetical protein